MRSYLGKLTRAQWNDYIRSGAATGYMATDRQDLDTIMQWSLSSDMRTVIDARGDLTIGRTRRVPELTERPPPGHRERGGRPHEGDRSGYTTATTINMELAEPRRDEETRIGRLGNARPQGTGFCRPVSRKELHIAERPQREAHA